MKHLISAILLGFGALSAQSQQKDYSFVYDTDAILSKGNILHDEGKYDEALKLYDKIDPIDPEYWRAQYEKAMTLAAAEQPEKAKAIYEQAYTSGLMAENVDFLMAYGSFLSDQEAYDKSEQIFLEALKMAPNYGSLLYNTALLYLRKEDSQKSVDYLKHSIIYNPQHPGSHYLLGLIAFDEGRVVEGSLALAAYLMLDPNGGGANKAILKMNEKFGQTYLEKGKTVFSKTGDDFQEIDVILRNQLPLKPAYKIQSDFEDPVIRQLQAIAEYAATHKVQDGFFETTYVPWLGDLFRRNQFEGFSYYILISMEESLGKKLSSKKKKIDEFSQEYIAKDYWPVFAKRRLDHFGTPTDVIVYLRNGSPYLIGQTIDGKKQGKFKSLHPQGGIAGELNLKDDYLDGLQKYYSLKGKLIEETVFSMGEKDGKSIEYWENGNIKSEEIYKKDKRDGLSTTYHINGGIDCQIQFKDDKKEGETTCFFEAGGKKSSFVFAADKPTGTVRRYNAQGDLTSETNYLNGDLEGKFREYFDGKKVKSEADYQKGNVMGSYRKFYGNGTLDEEYFYENGLATKGLNNSADGVKSYETLYDKKGKVEKYTYYDNSGKVYFEEIFKGGEIKSGLQYQSENEKPTETDLNRKGEIIASREGITLVEGRYDKSLKTGEWKGYYFSGRPQFTENFSKGNREGIKKTFHRNGTPYETMNYRNDTLQGICESYSGDIMTHTVFFKDGERNGPSSRFNPDGSLSARWFHEAGQSVSSYDYFNNGNLKIVTHFNNGEAESADIYSLDGKKEQTIIYKNMTGKFNFKYHNASELHEFEMKNGVLNGKYITRDKDGHPRIEGEYVSGKRINRYARYGATGALLYELNYYDGETNGPGSYYDPAGKLRLTATFVFGESTGKTTRYYCNGKKMYEYQEYEDQIDGEMTYFDHQGREILALGFANNELKYYKPLDASGKLGALVPVKNQTAAIVSKYANGNTAIAINYDKRNLEGKYFIGSENGKPVLEATYKNDNLEGSRLEYYPNGQLYKKEQFVNDNFEGVSEYFQEDGKLLLSISMKNDELHGPAKVVKNGKTILKTYDTNVLVDYK